MDVYHDFKVEVLNSGIESIMRGMSNSFQDFKRTYNLMGNRGNRRWSKPEREEKFRKIAATYEEYYVKHHARRHNNGSNIKSTESRNNWARKSMGTVPDNNNRAVSDLLAFRSRSTSTNVSTYSQTRLNPQNRGKCVQTSMSSCVDSGLGDIFCEEDDVFLNLNAATKDSICDHELDDNEIQITIFHEQKRNLLTVSIHRATPVLNDSGKLFAKVSVHPGKTPKQKGQKINVQKAKHWEEDFVFKKLTIGQLESCSVIIKIYQKKGILKSATEQYVAEVALKDVDIKDFQTTTLTLQKAMSSSS